MGIKHTQHKTHPDAVLVRTFEGEVSSDDIINSWKQLHKQNLFTTDVKGVLNNLDNCELTMSMSGFKDIMNYMKSQDHLLNLKIAVVTNSPKNIIFPALGEINEKPLNIKPFSTFDAAIEWISG